jgi:very-short-patch-repair endonuclease
VRGNSSPSPYPLPSRERDKARLLKMERPQQADLAKGLRRKQTEAEKIIWAKLKNRQLDGVKFRRQQPLGSYIVDFISLDEKLIIEIDGGQHNESRDIERDGKRMEWLEREGFHVVRFWNNDVLLNIEGVLEKIREVLILSSHPHLASPLKGEG